jgi:hypothetical protein
VHSHQTQAYFGTLYWIFIWTGLYKMAMLNGVRC